MTDYLDRIQRSLDYIEEHINDAIALEDVAGQACYSVTHYYRIFHVNMGCSLKEYIRERRLNRAAYELIATGKKVIDIAMQFQFESQESFTRAFQKRYGITPGKFRAKRMGVPLIEKPDLSRDRRLHRQPWRYEPHIVFRKEFPVVGMELFTTLPAALDDLAIPAFWTGEVLPRAGQINNRVGDHAIGFERYDPRDTRDIYHLACFEVDGIGELPKGMVTRMIPASAYAVFENEWNTPSSNAALIEFAFGEWLAHSEYELAGDYTFEIYREDKPRMELYIPVQ